MHQNALPFDVAAGHELAPLPSKPGEAAVQDAIESASSRTELDQDARSPTPSHAVEEAPLQQKWNDPKINIWRVVAACYGLMIMGLHDGAVGALLPYLESYYSLSYTVVSLVFVTPVVGFIVSALLVHVVHEKFGQRGIAIIGAFTRLVAYIIICLHPPFPVVVCAYALTGLGNGLEDNAWNAWMGDLCNANEVLGFLHGAYGLGGILGPLIATSMTTTYNLPWWSFGYVMVALLVLEHLSPLIFWTADGKAFRARNQGSLNENRNTLAAVGRTRVVWICAAFLLIYVGTEVSLTGWMNTFLREIRHARPFDAGLSNTMLWTGATLGRILCGFVTGRIGEKTAVFIYLGLSIVFHLLFYFVPSIAANLASIAFEGFFLGPLFPAAVVAITKLLPPHLQVAGVGVAITTGSAGACLLPFAVGVIAEAKGVQVLMPSVLAFMGAAGMAWACLPKIERYKRE